MTDDDPTFYEVLLEQSVDSRVDRFMWKPGDIVKQDEEEEEEQDFWESYWDQAR